MAIYTMEVTIMNVYRNMYYKLFNAITDALNALEQDDTEKAREVLITAQQTAEELYIEANDA
jgi:phosphate uptake regulator